MAWATGAAEAHAIGAIDSGAFTTSVPMWMPDRLGIAAEGRRCARIQRIGSLYRPPCKDRHGG